MYRCIGSPSSGEGGGGLSGIVSLVTHMITCRDNVSFMCSRLAIHLNVLLLLVCYSHRPIY